MRVWSSPVTFRRSRNRGLLEAKGEPLHSAAHLWNDSDFDMKRTLAAVVLIVMPGMAWAQQAAAPAAPGQNDFEMSCALFHRNADGSWNAVRPMTLRPASGPIPLKTSFKFRPGTLFAGFDLAAQLESACPH